MNTYYFELLVPLFHSLKTETPPEQEIAVFVCTREDCDFSTRYKMLEPQRNGARGPLPRRQIEVGPRKGKVETCYGGHKPLPDYVAAMLSNEARGFSPPGRLDWTDTKGRLRRVRCVSINNSWSYSSRKAL